MFENTTTGRIKWVDCKTTGAGVPSPLFAEFIQGKSLEDFKALEVKDAGIALVSLPVEDMEKVGTLDYGLMIKVVGDKISFSGALLDSVNVDGVADPSFNWTTPATIEQINEFVVEL